MKALQIQNGFGWENVTLVERPVPEPGAGEVLVRVHAASLNYRDLLIVKGQYNPKLKMPRILGSDAAGVVEAIGPGVTRFTAGERVIGCFMQHWIDGPLTEIAARSSLGSDLDGVIADYIVLSQEGLVHIPDHLSFEESATLPCAGVTAWRALVGGGCGPGKTILLLGTGGVSIFALQFAKAVGARVLITSSSDEKLKRALALGADAGVNYKTQPEWDKWAREQTGGAGADIVIEVGGVGTLERSIKSLRYGGHIALIGILSGSGAFNPVQVLMKDIRIQGVFVGSRATFEDLNRLIVGEGVRPVIDRVFSFQESVEALKYLERGSHFGKVVINLAN